MDAVVRTGSKVQNYVPKAPNNDSDSDQENESPNVANRFKSKS